MNKNQRTNLPTGIIKQNLTLGLHLGIHEQLMRPWCVARLKKVDELELYFNINFEITYYY